MNNDDVFSVFAKVMNLPVGEVSLTSSPENVDDWDSLKHLTLILTLEEEFNVEFDEEKIMDLMSLDEICKSISSLQK